MKKSIKSTLKIIALSATVLSFSAIAAVPEGWTKGCVGSYLEYRDGKGNYVIVHGGCA
ncbi:hypothetical protein [Pseudoalteromonas tunicata]|jgi:hypothetical protein|uniref:Orphan protein n=1 Tax=Pseudoalteromonas tunicata D2 TaxID=87626 RepID=A4CDW6_9GAMM|nr:hypothetical protein [Pseudoalteromonas tunicata]ATC96349.1 hypothetical protein PTUN_a4135 [Pseudoalteromonas tunicata]EAR27158.1 hypothetical protein PTD2_05790 [Pseudoalteromonas tunicata D2]